MWFCVVFTLPSPLFSTVFQSDGCLYSRGHGGSWLGCLVWQPSAQSPSCQQINIVLFTDNFDYIICSKFKQS